MATVPLHRLVNIFGEKDGRWLFGLARGIDDGEVEERRLPKSVSCGKTFRGASALVDDSSVHRWLLELAGELEERLAVDKADNQRTPQLLTVSIGIHNGNGAGGGGISRSCQLRRPEAAVMAADAAGLVRRWAGEQPTGWKVTDLFLGASNFVDVQATSITQYFKPTSAVAASAVDVAGDDGVSIKSPAQKLNTGGSNLSSMAVPSGPPLEPAGAAPEDPSIVNNAGDIVQSSTSVDPEIKPRTNEHEIDESVLAELPIEIQKEVRAALKMEQMMARASSSSIRGHTTNNKRPDAAQQTLKQFMSGKRPKR